MNAAVENLEKAAVGQECRRLRLPPMSDVAIKQRQTYLHYLEALLAVELEERERNTVARRIKDAKLAFCFERLARESPDKEHPCSLLLRRGLRSS